MHINNTQDVIAELQNVQRECERVCRQLQAIANTSSTNVNVSPTNVNASPTNVKVTIGYDPATLGMMSQIMAGEQVTLSNPMFDSITYNMPSSIGGIFSLI